ncbi:hypothetical protein FQR65_LT03413 [Abscondita terminalis]|nr:hypothetical protein FQR65_LT03413 [Abscondita terminalis]
MLRQRCESANGEAIKIRDDLMVKVNQLQRLVEEKDFALKVSAGDHTESIRYLKEQLDRTTTELQKTIDGCQYKINELAAENVDAKNAVAQKTQELIEIDAKLKHFMANSQINEEELRRLSDEQIKKLQFDLSEKNALVQQYLTELELLKRDCHNRNVNIAEKDYRISELTVQLENTLKLVNQLQVEKDNLQLAQIETNKQCAIHNQQCTDLLNQVAILSEKAELGERTAQELRMQKSLHLQLIKQIQITESQKQDLIARLDEEAKKSGEADKCYSLLELAKNIQISTNNEHTQKISELQEILETTQLKCETTQTQVEAQKQEILSLQNELLSAQQSCGPTTNTVSKSPGHTPTINTFLQIQLVNLKNSYTQLLQRFVGSQKLNVYLINKLERAVSNGDAPNIQNLLREFIQLRKYLTALQGSIEQDKFKFEKIISYALLSLHKKQVEITVQNNYIRKMQNIYNSLPTQCKLLQSNTVDDFVEESPNEAQIELEKTIQLIRLKDEQIQNLKVEMVSIQDNFRNLFNTKCPIGPNSQVTPFQPAYCEPPRVLIRKVPVIRYVPQSCEQIYPDYIRNQPILDQTSQECAPAQVIVQKVPVYVPRVVIKDVPRYVNENFKCPVPQVIYQKVPIPLPPKVVYVQKPLPIPSSPPELNPTWPLNPQINELKLQIQNLAHQLRICEMDQTNPSIIPPTIGPNQDEHMCVKHLEVIRNQENQINILKDQISSCDGRDFIPNGNQQPSTEYLLTVIENLKSRCLHSNQIPNECINVVIQHKTLLNNLKSISHNILQLINVNPLPDRVKATISRTKLESLILQVNRNIIVSGQSTQCDEAISQQINQLHILRNIIQNSLSQLNNPVISPVEYLSLLRLTITQFLTQLDNDIDISTGPYDDYEKCSNALMQQQVRINSLTTVIQGMLQQLNNVQLSDLAKVNMLKAQLENLLVQLNNNKDFDIPQGPNSIEAARLDMQVNNLIRELNLCRFSKTQNGETYPGWDENSNLSISPHLGNLEQENIYLRYKIKELLLRFYKTYPTPGLEGLPNPSEINFLRSQIYKLTQELNNARLHLQCPPQRGPIFNQHCPQTPSFDQETQINILKNQIQNLLTQLRIYKLYPTPTPGASPSPSPTIVTPDCPNSGEINMLKSEIFKLTQELNYARQYPLPPGPIINPQCPPPKVVIQKVPVPVPSLQPQDTNQFNSLIENLFNQLRLCRMYRPENQYQPPTIATTSTPDFNEINTLKLEILKLRQELHFEKLRTECSPETRPNVNVCPPPRMIPISQVPSFENQCPPPRIIIQKVPVPQLPSTEEETEINILKNQIQNLLMQLRFYQLYPRPRPDVPSSIVPTPSTDVSEIYMLKLQIHKLTQQLNYLRLNLQCPSQPGAIFNKQCPPPRVLPIEDQTKITILKNQIRNLFMQLHLCRLQPTTATPEMQPTPAWVIPTPDSIEINALKLQLHEVKQELNNALLYPKCPIQPQTPIVIPSSPSIEDNWPIPPTSDSFVNENQLNQCPPLRVLIRNIPVLVPRVIPTSSQPGSNYQEINYLNQKIQYLLYQLNNNRWSMPEISCIPERIVVPVPLQPSNDQQQYVTVINSLRTQVNQLVVELNNVRQKITLIRGHCEKQWPTPVGENQITNINVLKNQASYLLNQLISLGVSPGSLNIPCRPIPSPTRIIVRPIPIVQPPQVIVRPIPVPSPSRTIIRTMPVPPKIIVRPVPVFQPSQAQISPPRIIIRPVPVPLPSPPRYIIRPVPIPQPSTPRLILRPVPVIQQSPPQIIVRHIPVPQPSPPKIIIRPVPVLQPSTQRVVDRPVPVPVPQPSPPRLIVRPIPIPQPSPPQVIIRPVPVPQPSQPEIVIRPVPIPVSVPQPSPPRLIVRPIPIPQPSPPQIIIRPVLVPQPSQPEIVIRPVRIPVPVPQPSPPQVIVRPVPVPQPSEARTIIRPVIIPQLSPPRIIERPVPSAPQVIIRPVPVPQLSPPQVIVRTVPVPRIIIRPVPVPQQHVKEIVKPIPVVRVIPVPQPSPPRIIVRPVPLIQPSTHKIIIRPIPVPQPSQPEVVVRPVPVPVPVSQPSPPRIIIRPVPVPQPSQPEVIVRPVNVPVPVSQPSPPRLIIRPVPVPVPIAQPSQPEVVYRPVSVPVPVLQPSQPQIVPLPIPVPQPSQPQVVLRPVPVPVPVPQPSPQRVIVRPEIVVRPVPVPIRITSPPQVVVRPVSVPVPQPSQPHVIVRPVPIPQSSPPQIIIRPIPVPQSSPPRTVIKTVYIPQPSPKPIIRFIPVPQPSTTNTVQVPVPVPIPQPSPPRIIIKTVHVPQPTPPRIIIRPVPVPETTPGRTVIRPVFVHQPVPIPQPSPSKTIIKPVYIPQPSPPRIIIRPVPVPQQSSIIQPVPVPQPSPPRIIIKPVFVSQPSPPRIIIRPIPVPQTTKQTVIQPLPVASPPQVVTKTVYIPQPSPIRIISRPVPGPIRTVIKTVPLKVPPVIRTIIQPMPISQPSPPRIISIPVPQQCEQQKPIVVPLGQTSIQQQIEINSLRAQIQQLTVQLNNAIQVSPTNKNEDQIILLQEQIQNLLQQLSICKSTNISPTIGPSSMHLQEVNQLKFEIQNLLVQLENAKTYPSPDQEQQIVILKNQVQDLLVQINNLIQTRSYRGECPSPNFVIKRVPIYLPSPQNTEDIDILKQKIENLLIHLNSRPNIVDQSNFVPSPSQQYEVNILKMEIQNLVHKLNQLQIECYNQRRPCVNISPQLPILPPNPDFSQPCPISVPVPETPRIVIKNIPVVQPPKIIIQKVPVPIGSSCSLPEVVPEVRVRYIPVPIGQNCPAANVIVRRVPILQPPRTIVKEVPTPQLVIKEVSVPQPPRFVIKKVPVFQKELCQATYPPTTLIKEVPVPSISNDCEVPKYVIQQVPVIQPPKIIVKTIPLTTPPREIVKVVRVPFGQENACPPPQILTQRIPVVQTRTVIKEVPISQPPRIIIKQIPVPQPPQVILKKVPVSVGPNVECPTPQVVVEKVEVPQPPRIIIKQVPITLPPRVIVQQVPKYVYVPTGTPNVDVSPGSPDSLIKEVVVPIDSRGECIPKVIIHNVPIDQPPKIIVKNVPIVMPPKIIIKKIPVGSDVTCRTPEVVVRPVAVLQPPRTILKEVPQPPKIIIKEVPVVQPRVEVKYVPVPVKQDVECPRPQVIVQKVLVPQPPRTIVVGGPGDQPPRVVVKEVFVPKPPQIILKEVPQIVPGGIFPDADSTRTTQEVAILRLEIKDLTNRLRTCMRDNFDDVSFTDNILLRPVQSLPQCVSQLERQKIIIKQLNSQLVNVAYSHIKNADSDYQIPRRFNDIFGGINKERYPSFIDYPSPLGENNNEIPSSSLNLPLPMLNLLKSKSPLKTKSNNGLQTLFLKVLHEAFIYTQSALSKCMNAVFIQQLDTQTDNDDVGLGGDRQLIEDKEMAEGQIQFLNSIIVDMQRKSQEQQARIELLESGYSPSAAEELKLIGLPHAHQRPPRVYCDICELFDDHETEDCPLQASGIDGIGSPSYSRRPRGTESNRSYCEICEIFGHCTEDCKEDQTF